jgi:2-polyprenyl-3-methyl-5-hydroxy-6-metoxy-1,4-benzoquinol methylase
MASMEQFKTYLQPDNKNLFQVFSSNMLNIDWKNVSILDYGCNQGNYLNSAREYINTDKYVGTDIMLKSIMSATHIHPDCRFLHYDKWHQAWNPTGDKKLKLSNIPLGEKFDVIVCYSVFTHTTFEQTIDELNDLKKLLNPNGIILFTIWSNEIFPMFNKWLSEKYDNIAPAESLENVNFAYWINTSKLIKDRVNYTSEDAESFNTFYNLEWFKQNTNAMHLGRPNNQYQELYYIR